MTQFISSLFAWVDRSDKLSAHNMDGFIAQLVQLGNSKVRVMGYTAGSCLVHFW